MHQASGSTISEGPSLRALPGTPFLQGARLANRPDDVSRGAPEQAIGQEREGAAGAKGGDT